MVLAIDLGWYFAASQKGGADFWNKQIIYENIDRFFGGEAFETDKKTRFAQVVWLMTHLFPWSVVLLYAMFRWFCGKRQDSISGFLHAWWLAIFAFFFFAAGRRGVYLLPIYPAVALLVARELAVFLDARHEVFGNRRPWRKRWVAAGAVIALIGFSFGTAIPIRRAVQQNSSDQEKFIEEVVAKVSAVAALYADPEFPYTTRIVLAYRLKRDIPAQALECQGEYYYLTIESSADSCAKEMTAPVTNSRKQTLHLLYVAKVT